MSETKKAPENKDADCPQCFYKPNEEQESPEECPQCHYKPVEEEKVTECPQCHYTPKK